MEAVADGDGEAREGLLVTTLRPNHEVGIHATPDRASLDAVPLNTYGQVAARGDSIFAIRSDRVVPHLEHDMFQSEAKRLNRAADRVFPGRLERQEFQLTVEWRISDRSFVAWNVGRSTGMQGRPA
jgi:hypothetical protein